MRRCSGPAGLGVEDDFFSRGGDSVLATRIVAMLREELQTDRIGIREIVTARTVAAMAAKLLAQDPDWVRIAEIAVEVSRLSAQDVALELDA